MGENGLQLSSLPQYKKKMEIFHSRRFWKAKNFPVIGHFFLMRTEKYLLNCSFCEKNLAKFPQNPGL